MINIITITYKTLFLSVAVCIAATAFVTYKLLTRHFIDIAMDIVLECLTERFPQEMESIRIKTLMKKGKINE